MVVAIVVLALAIAGAAAAVVVTRGSGGSTTASEQANAAAPRGSSSGKASPKLLTGSGGQPTGGLPTETYSGQSFSISYPKGWQIQSAEQEKGGYFDTTFVSGADPNMLLRVDYTPNDATDPMQAAQTVVNAVQRQPGYQQLDLSRGTFNGFPAAHWEFTVPEGGITLHKEDEFFTDTANNASVAVLTQAPQSQYSGLANQLARLRRSLTMK